MDAGGPCVGSLQVVFCRLTPRRSSGQLRQTRRFCGSPTSSTKGSNSGSPLALFRRGSQSPSLLLGRCAKLYHLDEHDPALGVSSRLHGERVALLADHGLVRLSVESDDLAAHRFHEERPRGEVCTIRVLST